MSKLSDDFLRPFSLPQVAMLHTLATEADVYGLTISDVINICTERLEQARKPQVQVKDEAIDNKNKNISPIIKCPECGSHVKIMPVNISKCTQVGGKWKYVFICNNNLCRWTELSESRRRAR